MPVTVTVSAPAGITASITAAAGISLAINAGPQGPAGPTGPTGNTGATGATGAQGNPGITTESIEVAISDETTNLNAGNAKVKFPWPLNFTLTEIFAYVNTAPVGSAIIIGVKMNGATILSTNITIDAGIQNSHNSGSQPVISVSSLTKYSEMQIDLIQVGSSTAGNGCKVVFIGTLT